MTPVTYAAAVLSVVAEASALRVAAGAAALSVVVAAARSAWRPPWPLRRPGRRRLLLRLARAAPRSRALYCLYLSLRRLSPNGIA